MDKSEPFHILALDGGGTRGIYAAQILAQVEEIFDVNVRDCFDLIAGTSTGSIIAGAAAVGLPMRKIVELFEKEAPRIFRKGLFSTGFCRSKYSRNPLAEVVREYLGKVTLGEISAPLMITSSDISTGGVYVFKSNYMQDLGEPYVRDGEVQLSDAILASCAAPSYFDPATVGSYLLADGGLWANNPSIIAFVEAIAKFGKEMDKVNILSIGTGHSTNIYGKRKSWGLLTGWGHQKLVSYFMSLQSQASTNMSQLLLKDHYLRLDPDIENWALDDTKNLDSLKALADRDFTYHSEAITTRIRRINK